MKTFSITDAGAIREMNQDFYFSSDTAVGNLPNLFIVADGMGGHKAGDYASRYTIERVVASVSRNAGDEPVSIIKEAINKANELLVEEELYAGESFYFYPTIVFYGENSKEFGALLTAAVPEENAEYYSHSE